MTKPRVYIYREKLENSPDLPTINSVEESRVTIMHFGNRDESKFLKQDFSAIDNTHILEYHAYPAGGGDFLVPWTSPWVGIICDISISIAKGAFAALGAQLFKALSNTLRRHRQSDKPIVIEIKSSKTLSLVIPTNLKSRDISTIITFLKKSITPKTKNIGSFAYDKKSGKFFVLP